MFGYTEKDVRDMFNAVNTAYEIIDGPAEVDDGLRLTMDLLEGLLEEGRI